MQVEQLEARSQQPSSWVNGDKVWDKAIELCGGDLDRFNAYCLAHPKFMRALGDGNSYARPVLGGIALGTYLNAVATEDHLLEVVALGLFGVAAVTDSWDGYFPRKGGVASDKGGKLDNVMDVILRSEIILATLFKGDLAEKMLVPPRVLYELKLLKMRNEDIKATGSFKPSSLGKAKVLTDSLVGATLIAEHIPKSPKIKRRIQISRKVFSITSLGLVATDVHRRQRRIKK